MIDLKYSSLQPLELSTSIANPKRDEAVSQASQMIALAKNQWIS